MKYDNLTSPPRQRTSVAIQGLDRSTPDDLCKDGTCQELLNLRWKDNAWRPVHKHKQKISMGAYYNVVYHHPAAGENVYIQCSQREAVIYSAIDLDPNRPFPQTTEIARFDTEQKISHFGNVLMFQSGTNVAHFFFNDGQYHSFDVPATPTLRTLSKTFYPIKPWRYTSNTGWADYTGEPLADPTPSVKFVWPISDITDGSPRIQTFADSNHPDATGSWHGELAFFVAYRMADGTILSPTMLNIIASEKITDGIMFRLTSDTFGGDKKLLAITDYPYNDRAIGAMQFVRATVEYNIPVDIDTELIPEVVCFCTRINSIFDYEKFIIPNMEYSSLSIAYADNNLPLQPFYLLGSKRITSGLVRFDFNRETLQGIESHMVYTPNANIHTISGSASLDYNRCLHLFDTTSSLSPCYDVNTIISPNSEEQLKEYTSAVKLNVNNKTYTSVRTDSIDSIPASPRPTPLLLSYPDYRAKEYIINTDEDRTSIFALSPAVANNLAYYIPQPSATLKYVGVALSFLEHTPSLADNSLVYEPNRIQVSSPNNPFSFPFDTSYSIGSSNNRILALQSAAIENSDEKIGEHPLYAFTEEGIFALRAGSETLYARVDAINYDKIINPNTLAINGGIVYITEKGVHLLTNAGSTVISTPIHDANGMPPLDFLRTCKILWPKQYNEIVLFNEDSDRAYVFNLDSAYWSTRQMQGRKINTDELIYGQSIYDLSDEDENRALPCTIETRPIKLGNVEFKRLETIIPRMATNNHPALVDIQADGSVDGSAYSQLRVVQAESVDANRINPLVLRRTPFSAKYFKVMLDMDAEPDKATYSTSITHIDFEWYQRFMGRMR